MSLRIVHVGLGPLGARIASELQARGLGTVVGAVDTASALAGKPLSSVVPNAASIAVSADLDDCLARCGHVDAAVVTTSSDAARCAETFRTLLRAGLPVVTTCEEMLWPWLRHPELAAEFDEAARRSGGRLLGTGVNPGFLMDTLPVCATAVCKQVRSVTVSRVQDATTRRVPFQRKIGATLSEEDFGARVAEGSLRHVGLGESLFFIAAGIGAEVADWHESIEPVRASRALTCDLGDIAVGGIAGVRQVATGTCTDGRGIRLDFLAAVGQDDPHDEVLIEGEPSIHVRLAGGVHGDTATCAITLNAIPSLIEASPGLHTMMSVPLVRCRR